MPLPTHPSITSVTAAALAEGIESELTLACGAEAVAHRGSATAHLEHAIACETVLFDLHAVAARATLLGLHLGTLPGSLHTLDATHTCTVIGLPDLLHALADLGYALALARRLAVHWYLLHRIRYYRGYRTDDAVESLCDSLPARPAVTILLETP